MAHIIDIKFYTTKGSARRALAHNGIEKERHAYYLVRSVTGEWGFEITEEGEPQKRTCNGGVRMPNSRTRSTDDIGVLHMATETPKQSTSIFDTGSEPTETAVRKNAPTKPAAKTTPKTSKPASKAASKPAVKSAAPKTTKPAAKAKAGPTDAEKAAKAKEKEAEKAAKAEAKAKEKAEAKAKRDQEREEKRKAKAEEAERKKAEREANRMPEQNGVRKRKPGTKCGDCWDIFDLVSKKRGEACAVSEALEHIESLPEEERNKFNKNNVQCEYAAWRKYHGIKGRIESAAKIKKREADEKEKAEAKAKREAEKAAKAEAKVKAEAEAKAKKNAENDSNKA